MVAKSRGSRTASAYSGYVCVSTGKANVPHASSLGGAENRERESRERGESIEK